jgi:hypothetical protein
MDAGSACPVVALRTGKMRPPQKAAATGVCWWRMYLGQRCYHSTNAPTY